jgi:ParB-like chromosome segregation protein Spo0J
MYDESVETVPVTSLSRGYAVRLAGEDPEHARVLAETDTPLPPILVHRQSMRVIDGMHRLRAAQLSGRATIAVRFFDGSENDAFVMAVRANVAHGLPLTLADRKAAAERILSCYPTWSNRAVAASAGLSAKTVSGLRGSGADETPRRLGLDGRVRPLDTAAGRRVAGEILAREPQLSLREVARAAGLSPGTVRDVRDRLRRGEDPAEPAGRSAGSGPRLTLLRPAGDPELILDGLRNDPSLRFTESGRHLLRWLLPRLSALSGWKEISEELPPHCAYHVAVLARTCAMEWLHFAEHLEERFGAASCKTAE